MKRQVLRDLHSVGKGIQTGHFVIHCIYEVPNKKVMVSYGEGIVLSFATDK